MVTAATTSRPKTGMSFSSLANNKRSGSRRREIHPAATPVARTTVSFSLVNATFMLLQQHPDSGDEAVTPSSCLQPAQVTTCSKKKAATAMISKTTTRCWITCVDGLMNAWEISLAATPFPRTRRRRYSCHTFASNHKKIPFIFLWFSLIRESCAHEHKCQASQSVFSQQRLALLLRRNSS